MSIGCPFFLYLQNNSAKDISGMYPELILPIKPEGEALGLFLTPPVLHIQMILPRLGRFGQ